MDTLTDPKMIGEVALIAIGAIMLGYFVYKIWPKRFNPVLFGFLATFGAVGGLAYMGNAAAAVALVLIVGLSVVLGLAALVM
ncbi:MAG: hypothetical protein NW216_12085 [Hyphomicrobium sp.]|nr:hypothetical protein [Hyphomicrobium sp.]